MQEQKNPPRQKQIPPLPPSIFHLCCWEVTSPVVDKMLLQQHRKAAPPHPTPESRGLPRSLPSLLLFALRGVRGTGGHSQPSPEGTATYSSREGHYVFCMAQLNTSYPKSTRLPQSPLPAECQTCMEAPQEHPPAVGVSPQRQLHPKPHCCQTREQAVLAKGSWPESQGKGRLCTKGQPVCLNSCTLCPGKSRAAESYSWEPKNTVAESAPRPCPAARVHEAIARLLLPTPAAASLQGCAVLGCCAASSPIEGGRQTDRQADSDR